MPKAINIPFYAAEQLEYLTDNTVLISIGSGLENVAQLKVSGPKVLKVEFPDITGPIVRDNVEYSPMSGETGAKIIDFINENLGKNFIIHCHAGISRSAALCLYLNIKHGYELKRDFWKLSHPNPYVLGTLFSIDCYKNYLKTLQT